MSLEYEISESDFDLPPELQMRDVIEVQIVIPVLDVDNDGFIVEIGEEIFYHSFPYHFQEQCDYGDVFAQSAMTFQNEATDLVPVDTGFLMSTIGSGSDDHGASFYVGADYAQYVEYGTWKMAPQPYFEPAVMAAIAVVPGGAGVVIEEAWAKLMEEYERFLEDVWREVDQLYIQHFQQVNGWLDGYVFYPQ